MSTSTISSQGVNISSEQSVPPQVLPKQNDVEAVSIDPQANTANSSNSTAQNSINRPIQINANELAAKRQEEQAKEESEQSQALLEESIESVTSFVSSVNKNVDFLLDEDSGRTVIKVIDMESQELIKQFPSEEIISMAARIKELQEQITSKTGLFLDENV